MSTISVSRVKRADVLDGVRRTFEFLADEG